MPEKTMERFYRNRGNQGIRDFVIGSWSAIPPEEWKRDINENIRLLEKQRRSFSKEKIRVEDELNIVRKDGKEHPNYLEITCLEDHLHFVGRYLDWINSTLQSKDKTPPLIITSGGKEVGGGKESVGFKMRPSLMDDVADFFKIFKESDPHGNMFVEKRYWKKNILVINDLAINDEKLKKIMEPFTIKNVEVKPFGELAQKLIVKVKELNPDMIILPLRGAQIFKGLIPKGMHDKIHEFHISEHLESNERFKAISELVQRVKKEKPKKVVWLDDKVFVGMQSETTRQLLKNISPNSEFHALALAAYEQPRNDINYYFAENERIKGDRVPMLASKWIRLFAKKERDRKNNYKADKLLGLLNKDRKEHGESGSV